MPESHFASAAASSQSHHERWASSSARTTAFHRLRIQRSKMKKPAAVRTTAHGLMRMSRAFRNDKARQACSAAGLLKMQSPEFTGLRNFQGVLLHLHRRRAALTRAVVFLVVFGRAQFSRRRRGGIFGAHCPPPSPKIIHQPLRRRHKTRTDFRRPDALTDHSI